MEKNVVLLMIVFIMLSSIQKLSAKEMKEYIYLDKKLNAYVKRLSNNMLENDNDSSMDKVLTTTMFNNIKPRDIGYELISYKFVRKGKSNYTGDTLRVTNDINCNVSKGCSISKNVTKTIGVSFSVNLSASEQSAVRANAGISGTNAKSETETYSFNLKKGEKGYIGFKPYKAKSWGILYTYNNRAKTKKKNVTMYAPRKFNGHALGNFYFVYTNKK